MILIIICLLPISALADLGKTYAECDYSRDFRRITYDPKQRVSQWLNEDWYIMETFDINSHESNMITYTKLNRERIRRDEMHTGSSLFPVGNLVRWVESFIALRFACSRSKPT
jgi:hypothetical protein